jgi:hypothetical protein
VKKLTIILFLSIFFFSFSFFFLFLFIFIFIFIYLFLFFAGLFSPTMFSLLYGHFDCLDCERQADYVPFDPPGGPPSNTTIIKPGFFCKVCTQTVVSM